MFKYIAILSCYPIPLQAIRYPYIPSSRLFSFSFFLCLYLFIYLFISFFLSLSFIHSFFHSVFHSFFHSFILSFSVLERMKERKNEKKKVSLSFFFFCLLLLNVLYPLKTSEKQRSLSITRGFLIFSRGIERDQLYKMSKTSKYFLLYVKLHETLKAFYLRTYHTCSLLECFSSQ